MTKITMSDKPVYLHCINLADIKQVFNFLPGGGGYQTPASVDLDFLVENGADWQRIETVRRQKEFYTYSEEKLRYGLLSQDIGLNRSYRIDILVTASELRSGISVGKAGPNSLIDPEYKDGTWSYKLDLKWAHEIDGKIDSIIELSEIEIAFEMGRRKYAPNAPSRLTCLFMVENGFEGRIFLAELFDSPAMKRRRDPLILELSIVHEVMFLKTDSEWFNRYSQSKDETLIKNYWLGIATESPKWEVLFEGIVVLREEAQKEKLRTRLNSLLGSAT